MEETARPFLPFYFYWELENKIETISLNSSTFSYKWGLSFREMIAIKFICSSIIPSAVCIKYRSLWLIRIKPPDKKTISKGLFLVTCLSNVEHYIIILFKELFNNSNKCLFEFWIQW